MPRPKVVIVGAGPAGGSCALALAQRNNVDVVVLDKSSYPRVKVCGSGLSPSCLTNLKRLGIEGLYSDRAVRMNKMLARGPAGQEVFLSGNRGAWVVPRVEFDNGIITTAERAGVRFQQDTKVVDLLRDSAGEVRGVKTADEEIEADLVVCANGSPSRFSRDESDTYGIRTIMGWWKGTTLPTDQAIMSWDRRLDGYYAWAFPEPDGVVNIGITIPERSTGTVPLKDLFQVVMDEQFGALMKGAEQIGKWMGHPATVTTRVSDAVTESRVMWIGEAARLVSPGTVEGISFAMQSGILAAEAIDRHFEAHHGLSKLGQRLYRTRVAARMLPKFWAGEAFVRLMRSERARKWSTKLNPQWLASKASTLVGESPA